jgi:hypothetical protein
MREGRLQGNSNSHFQKEKRTFFDFAVTMRPARRWRPVLQSEMAGAARFPSFAAGSSLQDEFPARDNREPIRDRREMPQNRSARDERRSHKAQYGSS